MKKRYWIALGLLLVIALGAKSGSQSRPGTSYSSEPQGTKAVYLLFEKLGLQPEHLFHPFTKLDREQTGQVLFSIAPAKFGSEAQLLSWVAKGNRLVLFNQHSSPLSGLLEHLKVKETAPTINDIELPREEVPTQVINCNKSAPAEICSPPLRISLPQSIAINQAPAGSNVLLRYKSNDLLFQIPWHKGDIWVFAGVEPISNQYIDKHDNLELMLHLARGASKIIFDEFHHGYTEPLSADQRQLWNTVILLSSVLALVMLIWALNRFVRFGPPLPLQAPTQSATLDFVRVLGALYQERGVKQVLAKYLQSWRNRLERQCRISSALSRGQLVKEMVYQGLISQSEVPELEASLIAIEEAPAKSPATLESAVRSLEKTLSAALSRHAKQKELTNNADKSLSVNW